MLRIESGALDDDGTNLELGLQVENTTASTLYACVSVRAIRYDAGAKALEVDLAPQEPGGLTSVYIQPVIVPVAARQRAHLHATLPRVLARPAPGSGEVSP